MSIQIEKEKDENFAYQIIETINDKNILTEKQREEILKNLRNLSVSSVQEINEFSKINDSQNIKQDEKIYNPPTYELDDFEKFDKIENKLLLKN